MIGTISKLMGKAKKLAAPRPNIGDGFDPARDRVRAEPLVLVVAPTRELCCQIFDEARRLCYRSMLRPCVVYGGAPTRDQAAQLQKGCDILIASPGRLLDFMNRGELLSLSRVRYTIVDEADEMLHDDWNEEMSKIMGGGGKLFVPSEFTRLLTSFQTPTPMVITVTSSSVPLSPKFFRSWPATTSQPTTFMSVLVVLVVYTSMSHRTYVCTSRLMISHTDKTQIIWCDQDKKMKALYDLLLSMPPSRTLVFVKFKKTADFVDDYLYNLGLPSTSIHSDRTQSEREDALRSFKAGKQPILVATGVSARGLDVRWA